MESSIPPVALLRWYLEAGVDEVVGEVPVNYYVLSRVPPPVSTAHPLARLDTPAALQLACHVTPSLSPVPTLPPSALRTAAELAAHCATLDALRAAVTSFEGCTLKTSAANTVFSDGVPAAPVMVIGEAPGVEEDQQGVPFVGPSGRLLDRMLRSIGLDRRHNCYITNVVPWRPPANRKPTLAEVNMLLPFLERHITLTAPQILLLVGGLAASVILARPEGIMKLRGQWLEYSVGLSRPIPAIATFHPAYLLRSPAQKRFAWRDLLALRHRLEGLP